MISHVYEDNGMSNHKITEIIPDEIFNNPDLQWVRDAFEEGQFFIDERVHCFSWQELTTTPDDDFHLIKKHYRGWTNIPHVPPL